MKVTRLIVSSILVISFFAIPHVLLAETKKNKEVDSAIAEKSKQIEDLERQIAQYQNEMQNVSGQAKTLGQEVSTLKSSERILETSVKSTNTKLQKTAYTITKNTNEIEDLSLGIYENRNVIAESIRAINVQDSRNPVEMFLGRKTLSDFLRDYQDLAQLQNKLRGSVRVMQDRSFQLAQAQQDLADRKKELQSLSGELSDKEKIIADQRKQKDILLKETKNKESEYQKKLQPCRNRLHRLQMKFEIMNQN